MTTRRTRRARPHLKPEDLRWVVQDWASRIDVKMPHVYVRTMRRKWASMSTAGRLTLNEDLCTLPRDLIDLVVVHELVHLLTPHHGQLFKSYLYAYMPDWERREEQLREKRGAWYGQPT